MLTPLFSLPPCCPHPHLPFPVAPLPISHHHCPPPRHPPPHLPLPVTPLPVALLSLPIAPSVLPPSPSPTPHPPPSCPPSTPPFHSQLPALAFWLLPAPKTETNKKTTTAPQSINQTNPFNNSINQPQSFWIKKKCTSIKTCYNYYWVFAHLLI